LLKEEVILNEEKGGEGCCKGHSSNYVVGQSYGIQALTYRTATTLQALYESAHSTKVIATACQSTTGLNINKQKANH
jgi:hypothetical protein